MEKSPEDAARAVGHIGWFAISAFVAVWDYKAEETLSSAFSRGLDNEKTKPWVIGTWAVTTAHLMRWIPEQVDPFYLPVRVTRYFRNGTSS